MITHIDHYPYERVYRINDDGTDVHWTHRPTGYVRRYLLGHEPANYPVPALIGVGNSTDLYTMCWFIEGWYQQY